MTTRRHSTQRAVLHRRAGEWPEELAVGSLTLNCDDRHRRRIRLNAGQGHELLLDLPRASAMADRDGLQLEDGAWLMVQAAAEPVVEVTHAEPGQLMRLAWHLGNRHVPTEIRMQSLRIRPDHVIEEMLRGFGATLEKMEAGFQPEGGAYSSHSHAHDHGESHHHGEL